MAETINTEGDQVTNSVPEMDTHIDAKHRNSILRGLLKNAGAAALASALAAGAVAYADMNLVYNERTITRTELPASSENLASFREKFVQLTPTRYQEGEQTVNGIDFTFSDTPHPYEVKDYRAIVFNNDQTGLQEQLDNGNVILRRDTSEVSYALNINDGIYHEHPAEYKFLWPDYVPSTYAMPSDIKATYVVPVFGDSYRPDWISDSLNDTNATFRGVDVKTAKGTAINGDVWWTLADANGNYVGVNGQRLAENEQPYFIPGFYVELQDKYFGASPFTQTPEESQTAENLNGYDHRLPNVYEGDLAALNEAFVKDPNAVIGKDLTGRDILVKDYIITVKAGQKLAVEGDVKVSVNGENHDDFDTDMELVKEGRDITSNLTGALTYVSVPEGAQDITAYLIYGGDAHLLPNSTTDSQAQEKITGYINNLVNSFGVGNVTEYDWPSGAQSAH